MNLKLLKKWKCEGGEQSVYSHESDCLRCSMEFSVFVPGSKPAGGMPVLYYLSGLTCTWENAVAKAGAQRHAEKHGLIMVFPDTSPRGAEVPDEPDDYSFGQGAGFYLNATQEPWKKNYRMYDYVTAELRAAVNSGIQGVDCERTGIAGHSMGGHGALTLALKNPDVYRSVSAFAPIVSPSDVPWGKKALGGYLGSDQAAWAEYDACKLVESRGCKSPILVDQGAADNFLGTELLPEKFIASCSKANVDLTLRMQGGYDHSYYFISTFMGDHVAWHAGQLR